MNGTKHETEDSSPKKVNSEKTQQQQDSSDEDEPCTSSNTNATTSWYQSLSDSLNRTKIHVVEVTPNLGQMKQKVWSKWNHLKYNSRWIADRKSEYDRPGTLTLLGMEYEISGDEKAANSFDEFFDDYYSRVYFTYRTHVTPFEGTEITSDCGWGCMIRTVQMMIVQAIVLSRLGRGWRYCPSGQVSPRILREQLQIIRLFEDTPAAPLSIHRLLTFCQLPDQVGQWFTPSACVQLFSRAVSQSISPVLSPFRIHLCSDGRLSVPQLDRLSGNWTRQVILFVSLRLGTSIVNEIYYPHIRHFLSQPNCLGIGGGKKDHSLYFIGHYLQKLIYIDPHVAQKYSPLLDFDDEEDKFREQLSLFHCESLSKMDMEKMNPSCCVGFLFRKKQELDNVVKYLNLHQVIDVDLGPGEGAKRTKDPLFTVFYSDASLTQQPSIEEQGCSQEINGFEVL
ncbi:hypothetical protein WR25_16693 [Diploscapter pachys]|uniref:Cysteine protease n=1 Tax=Diploscapter pachys TaxID=2018661 RepID=A0A2A2LTV3_9BILA|nr:hypothetical protein WR25_16693 [Diploscapter pachys]